MSIGELAGLIAALAFVLLVGFLGYPLYKLGKVFDETTAVGARHHRRARCRCSSEVDDDGHDDQRAARPRRHHHRERRRGVRERGGADPAVRRDARLARRQGRRLLLRACRQRALRAGREPAPRTQGLSGVRRVFWMALGATVGIVVVRRVSRAAQAYTPEGIGRLPDGRGRCPARPR